jgi:hypothetical protein
MQLKRKSIALILLFAALITAALLADIARLDDRIPRKVGPQPDGSVLVPTNQLLRPAGFQVLLPGRPTDLALSPDGKILAVKNMGNIPRAFSWNQIAVC